MREVDGFLRRYATPVLERAGYRRKGRQYVVDGPRGRRATVKIHPEVRADMSSFDVRYGVITPTHAQFQEDRGFVLDSWPPTTAGLLHGQLDSPDLGRVGAPGPVLPSKWVLGDDRHNAEIGPALAHALEYELVPRIDSWFDPEVMVRTLEYRGPGIFPGLSPKPRAVAMALMDVDDPGDRLQKMLALLPPDDMVRQWIEERLAKLREG